MDSGAQVVRMPFLIPDHADILCFVSRVMDRFLSKTNGNSTKCVSSWRSTTEILEVKTRPLEASPIVIPEVPNEYLTPEFA